MESATIQNHQLPSRSVTSLVMAIAMLVLGGLLFSGCAPAVVGVGTAAVAASSTEKGLTTSVSDGLVFTKIQDNFLKTDATLSQFVDVTVNDGAVLLTGKVKTPEEKVLATKLTWEVRGVREVCSKRPASWKIDRRHQCILTEFQHRCG